MAFDETFKVSTMKTCPEVSIITPDDILQRENAQLIYAGETGQFRCHEPAALQLKIYGIDLHTRFDEISSFRRNITQRDEKPRLNQTRGHNDRISGPSIDNHRECSFPPRLLLPRESEIKQEMGQGNGLVDFVRMANEHRATRESPWFSLFFTHGRLRTFD